MDPDGLNEWNTSYWKADQTFSELEVGQWRGSAPPLLMYSYPVLMGRDQ